MDKNMDNHTIFKIDKSCEDLEHEIRQKIVVYGNVYLNDCVKRDNNNEIKNELLKLYVQLYIDNHFNEIKCANDLAEHLMNPSSCLSLWKYIINMDIFSSKNSKTINPKLYNLIIKILINVRARHNNDVNVLSLVESRIATELNDNIVNMTKAWVQKTTNNNTHPIDFTLLWFFKHCDDMENDVFTKLFNNFPEIRKYIIKIIVHITKNNKINLNHELSTSPEQSILQLHKFVLSKCCSLWDTNKKVSNIKVNNIDFTKNTVKDNKSIDTQIFFIIYKVYSTMYTTLLETKSNIASNLQSITQRREMYASQGRQNMVNQIETVIKSYQSLKEKVDDIVHDENIFNCVSMLHMTIDELISVDKNNICLMNDNVNYSIPKFYCFLISELKNNMVDDKIYGFIMNVVSGKYKTNFPTRYEFCNVLLLLKPSDDIPSDIIINSLINYTNEVDLDELVVYKTKIIHQTMLIEYMFRSIVKSRHVFKIDEHTQKFIMKLTNNMVNISNNMNDSICEITSMYQESSNIEKERIEKSFEECFSNDHMYIHGVINDIFKVIFRSQTSSDKISTEISRIILRLIISLFKNYTSPIIDKHKLVDGSITNELEFIVQLLKYDNKLIADITPHVELLDKVSKKDKHKSVITKILSFIKEKDEAQNDIENNINFPDEFLDGITYEPVTEPVLIPYIETFFNKSTIITHLLNDQTNPLTREVMTFESFENHNKKPEIMEKINKFKLDRQKFIDENKNE